jgi:metal-responsive CopG/Arc/MetJ family transcriptional regulator
MNNELNVKIKTSITKKMLEDIDLIAKQKTYHRSLVIREALKDYIIKNNKN